MPEDNQIKILFVINPISGGKAKHDWENAITEFFRPLPYKIEFYILTGKNDNESIKHWLQSFGPQQVVAVGGDGTVSLVAQLILGTGIALGILPAGSANGMARELNIPEVMEKALGILVTGILKNADVIRINEQYVCLHLSDIGLNARLIKHFEMGKLRGKLGYASKVLNILWNKSWMKVKIKTDDTEITHDALMVVFANATKYGTGAVINPEGNLFDGRFEVVIVKKLAISELIKMLLIPRPFDPEKISLFPATSAIIETSRRVHFQVDGEYIGKVNKVEGKILPGQLKLIVPSDMK
jgi:diacylglycerol kinase (ATP)